MEKENPWCPDGGLMARATFPDPDVRHPQDSDVRPSAMERAALVTKQLALCPVCGKSGVHVHMKSEMR